MSQRTANTAAWRGNPLRAILFDLDGTLLDTAADIARALNRTLGERGIEPFAVSEVSRMIGRGSPILIERAAASRGHALGAEEHAALVDRFFHFYGELEESNESDAHPYAAVPETLKLLHATGLRMAVVTNKQQRFARALLERLELMPWLDLVVGGDTCARRKPDPQPLQFACQSLGVAAPQALMVGDSANDVAAARAAGIAVVCVPYGYTEGKDPGSLDCDAMIDTFADLPPLLWT